MPDGRKLCAHDAMRSDIAQSVNRSLALRLVTHKRLLMIHHGVHGNLFTKQRGDDGDRRLLPGLNRKKVYNLFKKIPLLPLVIENL